MTAGAVRLSRDACIFWINDGLVVLRKACTWDPSVAVAMKTRGS